MRSTRILLFLIIFCGVQTVHAQVAVSLEDAIQIAIQKNFDVVLIRNNAAAAETDKSYSLGPFLPVITANATRSFNTNDQRQTLADGTIREGSDIKSNSLSSNVQAVWTLFDGTKMFVTRKRVLEAVELSEINVKATMLSTVAQVINNYYNIVRQKQQLKATSELIAFSEERLKLADLKLQVGTGSKPELLQAKVDLNAQRTTALQQETLLIQQKDMLNQLLGMELTDAFEVSDTIPINLTLSRDEILGSIEKTSQVLLSNKKALEIQEFIVRERKAEIFPTINLTSSYTFQRQENKVVINNFSTLQNQNIGFNYGLQASLPILNQFNNRRSTAQARVALERQRIVYEQQKSVVVTNVKNAFTNYDNTKKILMIEEENIGLARENASIALERFKQGISTFIEVRTAQQSLADGYNRLITARYNAKLAETELLRQQGDLVD